MPSNTVVRPISGSNESTRARGFHVKVRTGCVTCKHRRIKCDESKPSCKRCIKSGWECSYQKQEPKKVITKRPLAPKLANAVGASNQRALLKIPNRSKFQNEYEYQAFQNFCEKTVFTLAGFEEPDVWNRLVLQACESQESIKHTVIALGALDKTLETAQTKQQQPSFDITPSHSNVTLYHQFALEQYGKAVRKVREDLSDKKQDLRTTLISCLLFIAFELFHGNHPSALTQGSIGLKMIVDRMKDARKKSPDSALQTKYLFSSIEEALIQKFVRLDLSTMSFVDETVIRAHDTSESETLDHLQVLPKVFSSLGEAQKYWELSVRRIMDFMALTSTWKDESPQKHLQTSITAPHIHIGEDGWKSIEKIPDSAAEQRNIERRDKSSSDEITLPMNSHMQRALEWSAAFQPLFDHSRTPEGKKDFVRATLLQMRLKTTMIAATTSPLEGELQFDKLTPIYIEILDLAESISEPHLLPPRASFTFDVGPIGPLFIVATRCRDCVLRRKAIRLLLANPRRECFWDNIVAAKFATAIMVMEERGLRQGVVLESARIRIEGITFNLVESRGTLRYSRGKWRPPEERVVESIKVTW